MTGNPALNQNTFTDIRAEAGAGTMTIQGTVNKTLAIYRATDGEKLWETPVQTVPIAV